MSLKRSMSAAENSSALAVQPTEDNNATRIVVVDPCTKRARISATDRTTDDQGRNNNDRLSTSEVLFGAKTNDDATDELMQSDIDLASELYKFGKIHYEKNHIEKALAYYSVGLTIQRATTTAPLCLEDEETKVIATLSIIAQIHKQRGDFESALHRYGEIHTLRLKRYGSESLQVAKSLSDVALMHYHLKMFTLAYDMYQQALDIQRQHCFHTDAGTSQQQKQKQNLDVASTLNSIGLVLFGQGKYDIAKTSFEDSLRIQSKFLGSEHPQVAVLLYNLAATSLQTGDDDSALELFKESFRIEVKAFGSANHGSLITLQNMGMICQQRGELEDSLHYFEEVLRIERAKKDHQPFHIAKILNLMGNIYLQKGQARQVMDCFIEASRLYRQCNGRGSNSSNALIIAGHNFYGLSRLHPPAASKA